MMYVKRMSHFSALFPSFDLTHSLVLFDSNKWYRRLGSRVCVIVSSLACHQSFLRIENKLNPNVNHEVTNGWLTVGFDRKRRDVLVCI